MDAILNEIGDCVIRNDEERLKDISPSIPLYWRGMGIKHGCLCVNEQIVVQDSLKLVAFMDAVTEDIHSTHPGSFAMLSLAQKFVVAMYSSRQAS